MAAPVPAQMPVSSPKPVSDVRVLGGWSSPFVMRTRIAFNIKSVNYDLVPENLGPKSELLLKSNPVYKTVPVLIHGEKTICDSLNIIQYIDEYWTDGPSILPRDPFDRSLVRFWAAFVDKTWFPSVQGIILAKSEEKKAECIEESRKAFEIFEEAYMNVSKGNKFFGGEDIGYLDIIFGSYLGWLTACEPMTGLKFSEVVETPELMEWAERFRAHDAVKDVMPTTRKLTGLGKMLLNRLAKNRSTQDKW